MHVLIAVMVALIIAQGLKGLILYASRTRLTAQELFTRGMPSVHSAVVVSLCTGLLITRGLDVYSIVSIALSAIVIRDALSVRDPVEEHRILVRMARALKTGRPEAGHNPWQVFVGALMGALCGLLVLL